MNRDHLFITAVLITVCAVLIVITTGCAAGSSKNINVGSIPGDAGPTLPRMVEPLRVDRVTESYRAYSTILDHKWHEGNVAVRDHTDRGLFQNDQWLDENAGKSYPEAVSDFRSANDKDVQIESRFEYSGKLSLIDQGEFKKTIGGGDGWDVFRKAHPGASGIVTFSAVGFDRDGSRAVVNVAYLCASHCGNGTFYILEKTNGEWTIAKEIGTWMS